MTKDYEQSESKIVELIVRNSDQEIRLGDWMGECKVIGIEAYGKQLDYLGQGMTGMVTLTGMPSFVIQETNPEMIERIKRLRNEVNL